MPACALKGSSSGLMTSRFQHGASAMFSPMRLAVHGERLAVEHVLDLAHHRRQSARVVEIFHEVLARRLQVHETGQLRADLVPVLELERHADAPGNRQQVNDRVGRAADRGVHADRILERRARENLRQRHFFFDHLDDAPPGELRLPVAARIDGGNRRVAGQRNTQRFDHARHGRCRAHGHAMTLRAMHAGFGGGEFFLRHAAAAHVFGHLPHARARADLLAAEMPGQHRAAGDADGGKVAARRAHEQRGRGLVAAHEQHDAVEWDCRGSIPRRPCWRDCGTTSRWDAAAFHPATSPEIRAESRRLRRRRASRTPRARGSAHCRESARSRCCRCR